MKTSNTSRASGVARLHELSTLTILLAAAGALALMSCAEGIDPPEPTTMVVIRGISAQSGGMRFVFGDEESCPAAVCTTGGKIVPAYPAINVELKPFAIDEHEVTNRQYESCVEADDCSELIGFNLASAQIDDYYRTGRFNDYPVVNVTARQAEAYCRSVGKRLPTELEWEFLVRGGGANIGVWPFGDRVEDCLGKNISVAACDSNVARPSAAGTAADDAIEIATIDGTVVVYDMIGNVSEWIGHPYVKQLTCAFEQGFEEACGLTCEANCGADEACVSNCRRVGGGGGCDYCDPETGTEHDCFMVCDLAMCERKVDSFVLQSFDPRPENLVDDPMLDYVIPEYYPYRGGNFKTSRTVSGDSTFGSCALRNSYRQKRMDRGHSKDWLGFRCAQDL